MCNYWNSLHIVLFFFFQRQEFTIQSGNILKELVIVCIKNTSSPPFCMDERECKLDDQVLKFCEAMLLITAVFFRTCGNK